MNCPKCKAPMVIDEWYGWHWTCFDCDYVGRAATDAETKNQEKELEEYYKQSRKEFER